MSTRKKNRAHRPRADLGTAVMEEAKPGPVPAHARWAWMVGLLPGLVALIAFAPCLENGLTNWDDSKNVILNQDFRGLGWQQLRWAWTTFLIGVYQPLSWMLLEAQYVGGGLDPWIYHATSLGLYAIAAVVLDAMTVALLTPCRSVDAVPNPWAIHLGAALAVALFVVHPLRTEVVAWVSCQPYLPCALFSMLVVLAYLRAHPEGRPARVGWVLGAILLFAAALLSKAVAVTLPGVLLILDVYPLRRIRGGSVYRLISGPNATWAWIEKLPYIALSVVFIGISILAKRSYAAEIQVVVDQGSLSIRIAQACYSVWFYLAKTVWPAALSPYYPLPLQIEWSDPRFLLSGLAVAAVTVVLILLRRRWPALLAVWGSYLVTLAPNSGLIRIGGHVAADRYSFMAMMGFVVLAAAGLSWLMATRVSAKRVVVVALAGIVGLTAMSRAQSRIWHDSVSLWTQALACDNQSAFQHLNVGKAFSDAGDLRRSMDSIARAIQINPNLPDAHEWMGRVLSRAVSAGLLDEAEVYMAAEARRQPKVLEARVRYGELLLRRGRPAEAAPEFAAAVELQPQDANLWGNLGAALLLQGKLNEAAPPLEQALQLTPRDSGFQSNLGMVRAGQGRLDEAIALYTGAIRNRPDDVKARMNLGMLMVQKGQLDEAEAQFREVLRLQPNFAMAHDGLAEVARKRGPTPSP